LTGHSNQEENHASAHLFLRCASHFMFARGTSPGKSRVTTGLTPYASADASSYWQGGDTLKIPRNIHAQNRKKLLEHMVSFFETSHGENRLTSRDEID
jgi:hypothetical protein